MPRMKMTAMKQSIPSAGRKLILPAPHTAMKSAQANQAKNQGASRTILPAPGFKAKTILPMAKKSSSQPARRERGTSGPSHKVKVPNRLKAVKTRLTVKRDAVSKRFVRFSIPKIRFQKLVRDIAWQTKPDCKFQVEALYALQVACEDFLAGFFYDANLCTLHAKRVTLMEKDMGLVKALRRMETQ